MVRLRRRSDLPSVVAVVSGGHFLSHFYILTFPPLFPLLADEFGLTNTQLGLIMSAVALGMFLQIPAGGLVNRIGAKRVFVLGVGLTGTAIVLCGLAPSYQWILVFALLSGIGQSAFHPADYALLEAANAGRDTGKSFGVHTFAGYVGFAAAPAIAGTIGFTRGWETAAVVVGLVGIAYAIVAELTLDTVFLDRIDELGGRSDRPTSLRASLAGLYSPTIAALFLFFVALIMAGKGLQTFTGVLVVEALGQSAALGNAALTAFFAFAAMGVLAGGGVADRSDPPRVIAITLGGAAMVTWVLGSGALDPGPVETIALFSVLGGLYGMPLPSRDRLVSSFSSTDSIGVNFGIVFTGASIGSLASPALLGATIDRAVPALGFVLVGVFFAAAVAIALAVHAGLVARVARTVPSP